MNNSNTISQNVSKHRLKATNSMPSKLHKLHNQNILTKFIKKFLGISQ